MLGSTRWPEDDEDGVARVGPFLRADELVYRHENLAYRQALVEMLRALSVRDGDDEARTAERIFYRPAQRRIGLFNDNVTRPMAKNYSGPAGKCGVGMVVWRDAAHPEVEPLKSR